MAVTIYDVAKRANVSVATVSRVLNGAANVSEKSRSAVLKAVRHLDYSPNMLGYNLRKSKSSQILILVPTINNPFYSTIIEGAQYTAQKEGYRVLIANTYSDTDILQNYLTLLKQKLVDGLMILHPTGFTMQLADIGEKYPVVQCSEFDETIQIPYVGIDDTAASRAAVSHILNIGRKKIAIINSDLCFNYAQKRQKGYLQTLQEHGIKPREEWIKFAKDIDFDIAFSVASELFNGSDYPDGVFTISDVYAAACIKACRKKGLRVPQDVAVVGFDNVNISMMTDPTITTVNQPMYRMGTEAFKLLLTRIRNPDEATSNIILPADLVVRESTIGG